MYENYMADTVKVLAENFAEAWGGRAPAKRYYDMINPKEENRTAEQIIADIKTRMERLNGHI